MPLRLVLDTNIWLDWLVFDDAGIAPLKAAAAAARAEIFIDAACAAGAEQHHSTFCEFPTAPQRGTPLP